METLSRLLRPMRRSLSRTAVRLAGLGGVLPRHDVIIGLHDVPSAGALTRLLDLLQAHYRLISLKELLTSAPTGAPRAALSFDDGYGCWISRAAPLLRERQVPAVFFVNSGGVGLSGPDWERFAHERLLRTRPLAPLSPDCLRSLADEPLFEIGGHGLTHADPAGLSPADLDAEIGADRERLAGLCGRAPDYFAYAFGRPAQTGPAVRAAVRRAGYTAAVTAQSGFRTRGVDRLALPRIGLDLRDSPAVWRGRLRLAGLCRTIP